MVTLPAIRCLILGDDQIDLTMMLQKYAKMSGLEYDSKVNCIFQKHLRTRLFATTQHVEIACKVDRA